MMSSRSSGSVDQSAIPSHTSGPPRIWTGGEGAAVDPGTSHPGRPLAPEAWPAPVGLRQPRPRAIPSHTAAGPLGTWTGGGRADAPGIPHRPLAPEAWPAPASLRQARPSAIHAHAATGPDCPRMRGGRRGVLESKTVLGLRTLDPRPLHRGMLTLGRRRAPLGRASPADIVDLTLARSVMSDFVRYAINASGGP